MKFIVTPKSNCRFAGTVEAATRLKESLEVNGAEYVIGEVTEPFTPPKLAVDGVMQDF